MKRIKYLLVTLLLLLMTTTVYAEPSDDIPTGLLDLKGDVPEGLNGTIEFTVYNKTIDKEIGISLSYYNGYEAMVFAEFGDYEMSSATSIKAFLNSYPTKYLLSIAAADTSSPLKNGGHGFKQASTFACIRRSNVI